LDGVEAAHLKLVWHRDLKPENVLYCKRKDCLVVADFGIAHFMDEDLYTAAETRPGERLANFQYAAPEQRTRGQKVDQRADIFALGLMLTELFTGAVPQGTNPKTIGQAWPDFEWLDTIVGEMTQQDHSKRPATIDDVKRLIEINGRVFATRQKLSKLNNEVVPATEVDDPLYRGELKITNWDYDPRSGELVLTLNQPMNERFIHILQSPAGLQWSMAGPRDFQYRGHIASVRVPEDERTIQRTIVDFKNWIPSVKSRYVQAVDEEMRELERQRRKRIEDEKTLLETQLRLKKNIKLSFYYSEISSRGAENIMRLWPGVV
jgi:serine/threonine protein kinase